jgi:glyoxylase-like metal-dependent hydrolase (beta-lactamase superfamily II)
MRLGAMAVGLSIVGAVVWGIMWVTVWRSGEPRAAALSAAATAEQTSIKSAQCLARTPVRVAESVYLLGDMRPSVVYIVETSDGLAMIDAGLESAHDTLLAGMSKLGLDVGRLKFILLTHAHGDHTMGAQRLRDETGAKIYIGREDAGPLRRGSPWEAIFSKFDMQGERLHPTTIDGELTDQQVLELGQARFTVLATPGHTPGSCCFLVEINGERMLFTGDTISIFNVITGTYSTRLPPRYRGDIDDYRQSLEKLRRLPAPDLVLPGHPGADPAPSDPHFNADQWHALVDAGIADLDQLAQRYARDGADFLDGNPKEILQGLYYLGDFEGQAAYALVRDGRALLFDGARGDDAVRRLAAAWKTLAIGEPTISALVLTSFEEENLTGLRSIVEEAGCGVVAPPETNEVIARSCQQRAAIVSPDVLPSLGWGEIHTLPVKGAGEPELAYYFHLDGALVLVSGSMPIDADATEFIKRSRRGPPHGWDARQLAESLDRLEEITPTIWLAAEPWQGRNANLYDWNWSHTLRRNRELLRLWQRAP